MPVLKPRRETGIVPVMVMLRWHSHMAGETPAPQRIGTGRLTPTGHPAYNRVTVPRLPDLVQQSFEREVDLLIGLVGARGDLLADLADAVLADVGQLAR